MNIIVSYREQLAQQLYDDGKMFDFLPVINPRLERDMNILDTWVMHLAQQDIPFLVTSGERVCQDYVARENYILWKEKRV